VIPCGREDGKNSEEETPYELKIRKKGKYKTPSYSLSHLLCSERKQFEGDLL
jgi:hypothetical protein